MLLVTRVLVLLAAVAAPGLAWDWRCSACHAGAGALLSYHARQARLPLGMLGIPRPQEYARAGGHRRGGGDLCLV